MNRYKTLAECLEALARGRIVDQRENSVPGSTIRALRAYADWSLPKRQDRRLMRYGLNGRDGQIMSQDRFESNNSDPIAWFWWTGQLPTQRARQCVLEAHARKLRARLERGEARS